MRRLFWMTLGATAGVLVVRKLTKTAQAFTPAGMSESLGNAMGDLADSIREFAAEVRVGMAEREGELRSALGLDGTHDTVDAHTMQVAASPYALDPEGPLDPSGRERP